MAVDRSRRRLIEQIRQIMLNEAESGRNILRQVRRIGRTGQGRGNAQGRDTGGDLGLDVILDGDNDKRDHIFRDSRVPRRCMRALARPGRFFTSHPPAAGRSGRYGGSIAAKGDEGGFFSLVRRGNQLHRQG